MESSPLNKEDNSNETDRSSDSTIKEEHSSDEKKEKDGNEREDGEEIKVGDLSSSNRHNITEEIDRFLVSIADAEKNRDDPDRSGPLEVPDSVERLAKMVECEISKYDSGRDIGKWGRESDGDDPSSLVQSVEKLSKLMKAFGKFPGEPNYMSAVNRTSKVVHRTMLFMEEEFRCILEDCETGSSSTHEPDADVSSEANYPGFSCEMVSRMAMIANSMIQVGYVTECCQVFSISRRAAFEDNLSKLGFEKISFDDIQKMQWEALEVEIATWTKASKRCVDVYLPGERKLSESVFAKHPSISDSLYSNLARSVIIRLLNFAEAVAIMKRSAEKLFKFLDMYETLRDLVKALDSSTIFPGESSPELKSEISATQRGLGQSAVRIFSDLENSIKADNGKTPVPGGAVHPLTRYVMNYVKYACEYKETLEQVFQAHQKQEKIEDVSMDGQDIIKRSTADGFTGGHNNNNEEPPPSAFSVQLMAVMDLLDSNLNAKSKLYKDPSLSYIFLMNNGRYIMQKIKGSSEIHELLGTNWCRKRSSDLRQYHKNYQRETWSKVLGCLRDEGLHQGKGSVFKPALKERFKNFNTMFEEIHKTQSTWVVSDEQLQSELRVSISAVVIPAYRSFIGRFQQYLDPGRQTEKYIKYGPEELESCIEDLFDGTPASMVKRRS